MGKIHILFSRFSAFYSPLIATMAGGFLAQEGLTASHGVVPPGGSAVRALEAGEAQVAQSAVSQGFLSLGRGQQPTTRHFAQINERDGFFIAGREADPDFSWDRLAGRRVLVDHGGQPLAMFQYACHCQGLDYSAIEAVDAGDPEAMEAAFRAGEADFIQLQGPAPQQLAHEGLGQVLASVGAAIGPVAFSSLMATPEWLAGPQAQAFTRAYRKARAWVRESDPAEIAAAEIGFFPGISKEALEATLTAYQSLGCWSAHLEIRPEPYRVAQAVFRHAGKLAEEQAMEGVVVAPPS